MIFMSKLKMSKIIKYAVTLSVLLLTHQIYPQADFTIIGLPDTQYYTENLQGSGEGQGTGDIATFKAQTNWIVNNRVDSNIVYVAHLGDCVQNGDNVEDEWRRADTAMSVLEDISGLPDGIPYGIAVGNHDMSPFSDPHPGVSTTIFYNLYFGYDRFNGRDYYAGRYGTVNNDNHFDTLSVGSLKLIFVYIRYRAYLWNPEALAWADSILSAHEDRYGIIVSHKLLDSDTGDSVSFSTAGDSIYAKTRNNENLFLMLAGHWTNEGRRTETRGGDSTDVFVLMSDYQGLENGGDGWLRIMKFSSTDKKIYVTTYSPTLDSIKEGSDSQFELDYGFPDLPLPVELAYFGGTLNGNDIELRWRTETEINNYGFEIERSADKSNWLVVGFIDGHGNSNSPKQYSFNDPNIEHSGTYHYRLRQIDNDGSYEYSDVVTVEVGVPNNIYLSQNYPNPFNPVTRINFTLSEKQIISLNVYNTLGELVAELINEQRDAGSYSVTFNASNLPSGVYIYRLQTPGFITNKKMTLLK
jgi:hypothetical protein